MFTLPKITLTSLFVLILTFGINMQANAQTTTWLYDAADNSGRALKILEKSDGSLTAYFWQLNSKQWTKAEILHEGNNYLRVKSVASGKTYELKVSDDAQKVERIDATGKVLVHWLRK